MLSLLHSYEKLRRWFINMQKKDKLCCQYNKIYPLYYPHHLFTDLNNVFINLTMIESSRLKKYIFYFINNSLLVFQNKPLDIRKSGKLPVHEYQNANARIGGTSRILHLLP